jgi:hypothetical protein
MTFLLGAFNYPKGSFDARVHGAELILDVPEAASSRNYRFVASKRSERTKARNLPHVHT